MRKTVNGRVPCTIPPSNHAFFPCQTPFPIVLITYIPLTPQGCQSDNISSRRQHTAYVITARHHVFRQVQGKASRTSVGTYQLPAHSPCLRVSVITSFMRPVGTMELSVEMNVWNDKDMTPKNLWAQLGSSPSRGYHLYTFNHKFSSNFYHKRPLSISIYWEKMTIYTMSCTMLDLYIIFVVSPSSLVFS